MIEDLAKPWLRLLYLELIASLTTFLLTPPVAFSTLSIIGLYLVNSYL